MILILIVSLNAFLSEGSFIQQLNQFYGFDHNIFVFTDAINTLHEIYLVDDHPRTIIQLNNSNQAYKLENKPQVFGRIALLGSNCLLLVFLSGYSHEKPLERANSLNDVGMSTIVELIKWNERMKIGIIVGETIAEDGHLEIVQNLFKWSWKYSIIYVFVAFLHGDLENIFTYNPYDSHQISICRSLDVPLYFPEKTKNLFGHPVRIAFQPDPISIQYVKNDFRSKDGKLCEYILKGLNASYIIREVKNISFDSIENEAMANGVDLVPRLRRVKPKTASKPAIYTYPVILDVSILLVPAAEPYSPISAFLLNFTKENFLVLISLIFSLILILWAIRRSTSVQRKFLRNCMDVINLLCGLDIKRGKSTSNDEQWNIVSLSFGGFFFTNLILSTFISILAKPSFQPEIDTMDQFDQTSLEIVPPDASYVAPFLDLAQFRGRNWTDRINLKFDTTDFTVQIYGCNNKYSYLFTRSRTEVLIERQKHISTIRCFHVPGEHLRSYAYSYLVGAQAPFKDEVNLLILQAFSAGFYAKWSKEVYRNLSGEGFFDDFISDNDETVESFSMPLVMLYAWVLCTIVFVYENFYFRLRKLFRAKLQAFESTRPIVPKGLSAFS